MTTIEDVKRAYEVESDVEEMEGFSFIEESEWLVTGKWQYSHAIVQCQKTLKYFMICFSRSGSPYSDYEYDDEQFFEVERKEEIVVKVTWEVIG